MADIDRSLASVDSWGAVHPYSHEIEADHVLDLAWEITTHAEQPRDADGNDLDPREPTRGGDDA